MQPRWNHARSTARPNASPHTQGARRQRNTFSFQSRGKNVLDISSYRSTDFGRADVVAYQDVRDTLVGGGARVVHLARSFRATQPIQDCVNAAFLPEMQENRVTAQ